jgi:hypothetical protein
MMTVAIGGDVVVAFQAMSDRASQAKYSTN